MKNDKLYFNNLLKRCIFSIKTRSTASHLSISHSSSKSTQKKSETLRAFQHGSNKLQSSRFSFLSQVSLVEQKVQLMNPGPDNFPEIKTHQTRTCFSVLIRAVGIKECILFIYRLSAESS